MIILPAIDIKDGNCVRLVKGDYGTAHKVAESVWLFPVNTEKEIDRLLCFLFHKIVQHCFDRASVTAAEE